MRKSSVGSKQFFIRKVPDDLYWRMKELAAKNQMDLNDFLLSLLEAADNQDHTAAQRPKKSFLTPAS